MFKENLFINVQLAGFQDIQMPVNQLKVKKKQVQQLKMVPSNTKKPGSLELFMEILKKSNNSIQGTIYCPFLVYNQSGFNIRFRQNDFMGVINALEDVPPGALLHGNKQDLQSDKKPMPNLKKLLLPKGNNPQGLPANGSKEITHQPQQQLLQLTDKKEIPISKDKV